VLPNTPFARKIADCALLGIAGKDGKTKHAIENASKTRVVLADSKIHILGGMLYLKESYSPENADHLCRIQEHPHGSHSHRFPYSW
jgi:hypothetical protein